MSPSHRNMSTAFQEASTLDSYRFFSVPKGLKHILFFGKVALESLVMITVRVCTCIQILPPPGTLFPNLGDTFYSMIIFIPDVSCQI